jgi:hypothetical protein
VVGEAQRHGWSARVVGAIGGGDWPPQGRMRAQPVVLEELQGAQGMVFLPVDLQTAVAAVDAFIGLLIEIVFVASFTNRFYTQ